MSHDPALEAHEHTEHAAHAAGESNPLVARVVMSVAFLAVLATAAGSLETVEGGLALNSTSEAVLWQDRATDTWNEYQADSIKKHLYGIAANAGGLNADRYRKSAKEFGDMQDKLRKTAKDDESDRDTLLSASTTHEERHHWLTGSATLFEIGIAMSTVAIITHANWLWLMAMAFGAAGIVLLGTAYFG